MTLLITVFAAIVFKAYAAVEGPIAGGKVGVFEVAL